MPRATHTRSRAHSGRYWRASLVGWSEPAPWLSPDHWSSPVGDFPPGRFVWYPQFLDGPRSTGEDSGDDQLPKEHGPAGSAADDVSYPEALADEPWSLTLSLLDRHLEKEERMVILPEIPPRKRSKICRASQ